MSHQPLGLERVPLECRFNIAIKFRGTSPADFLTTVGLDIDYQLLIMRDERGSTVLHWAAMHWSIYHRRGWPSSRFASCADLIIKLITAGLCVSAIDGRGHTPLMYLLEFDDPSDGWPYGTYDIPDGLHPLHIIGSWGTLLRQAGVSLSEYVERENLLLSRLDTAHPVRWWWRARTLELSGIAFDDQSTLTMELCTTHSYHLHESRPMYGSFTGTTPVPCRLPWYPSFQDDPDVFWQPVEWRTLKSTKPFRLSPDSIDDIEFDLGRILFGGTQDDHMSLAAVYRREQQLNGRVRNGMSGKKRSSSSPPATTKTFVKNATTIPYRHSPEGSTWYVHKCSQDMRWSFCENDYGEAYDMRATCIAGCSARHDHGAYVAAAFVPLEKSPMTFREKWLVENFPRKYGTDANLRFRNYED